MAAADAQPSARTCPQCGSQAELEETDVGYFILCHACGFEAADPVNLDFKSD
ncbi:MAG: hypothetical protein R3185_09790 [Candidatus Thermoplasmatota archaeon]|nr:hypothetical protein [Candidatus Thermoplasmatota archaeon]